MNETKISAGILMYRCPRGAGCPPAADAEPAGTEPQVFLVHPGGPFFAGRDEGTWTIPKGLIEPGEEPLAAAVREFTEEVGFRPEGGFFPLGQVQQRGGKIVHAWGVETRPDHEIEVRSNTFRREWPPGSGRIQTYPEVDRGAFLDLATARQRVNPAQAEFLDRLLARLSGAPGAAGAHGGGPA